MTLSTLDKDDISTEKIHNYCNAKAKLSKFIPGKSSLLGVPGLQDIKSAFIFQTVRLLFCL